jgi:mRNA interferase MazF
MSNLTPAVDPIKLIAPITSWDTRYSGNFWHVKIIPNANNGLTKDSAVDVLQTRGVDISRFIRKIGWLGFSRGT